GLYLGIGQPLPPESFGVRLVPEVEPGKVNFDAPFVPPVVAVRVFFPAAGLDIVVTPVVHFRQPHAEAPARHRHVNLVLIVTLSFSAGGVVGAGHAEMLAHPAAWSSPIAGPTPGRTCMPGSFHARRCRMGPIVPANGVAWGARADRG